jgi:hypothetical protein
MESWNWNWGDIGTAGTHQLIPGFTADETERLIALRQRYEDGLPHLELDLNPHSAPHSTHFSQYSLTPTTSGYFWLEATSPGLGVPKEDCYSENLFSREPRRIDEIAYDIPRCR